MTEDLIFKKCVPCKGGIPPLADDQINDYLEQVSGWEVKPKKQGGKSINTLRKSFKFKDFRAAMAFLRQVEDLAEREGHHPDFCVHYNKVDFTLWTHAIGGLHDNDFILAAKIDNL